MVPREGQFEWLPVDQLVLDKSNPRVARFLAMYRDEITDEQMSLALGAGSYDQNANATTFQSLRASIRTHGGLIQPILVNRDNGNNLVVIEGNTRTLIYRQLKSDEDPSTWQDIPAIVYDQLDDKDIDAIRLQAHLVGPREWDPYSKARYLDYLNNSQHLTIEQIVDFCGGKNREVRQFIDAYNDMENFYRPLLTPGEMFDPTRFSAFVELQSERVQDALVSSGHSKTDFSRWVKDQKLFPLDRVRRLPAILTDPKAFGVFLQHGAREAEKVLFTPSTVEALRDASLDQLANEISHRIATMPYSDLLRLREDPTTQENDALTEARDQLAELCNLIAAPPSPNA